jgi:AcrR family transcriptional regulator
MRTQAERTAATTARLLDATIECLIELGYRATSTPEICRRAGVSRGAQLHHYATKEELVAAAVDHLFTLRLAEIETRLEQAASGPMADLRGVAAHVWSVYTGPTFYAWLELVVAARTDSTLRRSVAALDRRLVSRAEKMVKGFLLPFSDDAALIAGTTRLVLAIFDGLATHRILTGKDDTVARRALEIAVSSGLVAPKKGRS